MIKLTLCLVAGILFGYYMPFNNIILLLVSSLGFLALSFIAKYFFRNKREYAYIFGILAFLTMLSIGCFNYKIHQHYNHHKHYTKLNDIHIDSSTSLKFRVRKILKPSNFHNKYLVDILKIDTKHLSGRILLNVSKDALSTPINIDDIYITKTQLKSVQSPLNPYQFNYKNYLEKQYIYHQLMVDHKELFLVQNKIHTLNGHASRIRTVINQKLQEHHFKEDQLAIINALLLGQRQDISPEIYNNYAKAGAIHILAVSGLHVGIILLLLNGLFKPLERFKNGKTVKTILLVSLLWGFAIVAGASASIVRAVSMFTFVAIALNLKRRTNIYNTLFISAFILLLVHPNFLFDVGFQLSYLAVFAIVSFQPLFYTLWSPSYKIIDGLWKIFTVTLAAQLGVLPISLYYFHQFPGLFFVSNLVIIPFLGIILGMGILVIITSLLNILPQILVKVYAFIISQMNTFVSWIANHEDFLFKHIPFEIVHVFISYIFLGLLFLGIKTRKAKWFIYLLISVVISQGIFIYNKMTVSNSFVVFHKSRHSIIGVKHNSRFTVYSTLEDSLIQADKTLINYQIGTAIKSTKIEKTQSVYNLNGTLLLVIDSLGVYSTRFKPDIVLLQYSPKIHLERLIDSLAPRLIISDGSNYKSYQERWKQSCIKKSIPFHQTSEKGAFVYDY